MEDELVEDVPNVGETLVAEKDGKVRFIRVTYDPHASNPLEDWDGNGSILSLNRRHRNFNPTAVQEAIEQRPKEVVALSYFEHGQSLWFVAGDNRPGVEFQWDGVRFAGVWIPDEDTLKESKQTNDPREFLVERARNACEVYTDWVNGNVYVYSVQVFKARYTETGYLLDRESDYRFDEAVFMDVCGDIFGWESLESSVREALVNSWD